jgi:hypothetical protein
MGKRGPRHPLQGLWQGVRLSCRGPCTKGLWTRQAVGTTASTTGAFLRAFALWTGAHCKAEAGKSQERVGPFLHQGFARPRNTARDPSPRPSGNFSAFALTSAGNGIPYSALLRKDLTQMITSLSINRFPSSPLRMSSSRSPGDSSEPTRRMPSLWRKPVAPAIRERRAA